MGNHGGGMGRMAGAALAFAVLAGGVTASPAAAHGVGTNGCTLSPDSSPVGVVAYDFHDACDRHDLCYDELWFGRGAYDLLRQGWTGRLACDDMFLREMRTSCRMGNSHWFARRACEAIAGTYYSAVRSFGSRFFDNPNLN